MALKMRQEAASRANQSFTGYEADESMAVEEKMKSKTLAMAKIVNLLLTVQ